MLVVYLYFLILDIFSEHSSTFKVQGEQNICKQVKTPTRPVQSETPVNVCCDQDLSAYKHFNYILRLE